MRTSFGPGFSGDLHEHLCQVDAERARSLTAVALLRYFTVHGPRQRPDMGFRRFNRGGRRVSLNDRVSERQRAATG